MAAGWTRSNTRGAAAVSAPQELLGRTSCAGCAACRARPCRTASGPASPYAAAQHVRQLLVGARSRLAEQILRRRADLVAAGQQLAQRLAVDRRAAGIRRSRSSSASTSAGSLSGTTASASPASYSIPLSASANSKCRISLSDTRTRQQPVGATSRGTGSCASSPDRATAQSARAVRRQRSRSPRASAPARRQRSRSTRRPVLVVDVAVDARQHPLRSELLETHVEQLARLTEAVVAGVAEREHAERHALQPRRRVRGQSLPEQLGVVGHLALAVGGGDDQHVLRDRRTRRARSRRAR